MHRKLCSYLGCFPSPWWELCQEEGLIFYLFLTYESLILCCALWKVFTMTFLKSWTASPRACWHARFLVKGFGHRQGAWVLSTLASALSSHWDLCLPAAWRRPALLPAVPCPHTQRVPLIKPSATTLRRRLSLVLGVEGALWAYLGNCVSCGVMTTPWTNVAVSQSKVRETGPWRHLPEAEEFRSLQRLPYLLIEQHSKDGLKKEWRTSCLINLF